MTTDLVLFVTGFVVGAFAAGVAFGGGYAGFVLRVRVARHPRWSSQGDSHDSTR